MCVLCASIHLGMETRIEDVRTNMFYQKGHRCGWGERGKRKEGKLKSEKNASLHYVNCMYDVVPYLVVCKTYMCRNVQNHFLRDGEILYALFITHVLKSKWWIFWGKSQQITVRFSSVVYLFTSLFFYTLSHSGSD